MTTAIRRDMEPAADRRPLQQASGGALAWDNHVCMPMRPGDERFLPRLERCWTAGFDLVTLCVGFDRLDIEAHLRVLAHFRDWIRRHPERYRLVATVADARAAKAEGRLGVCFDIEGMNALGGQASLVRLYYDLGVRWMLVAYNRANAAGGGCLDAVDGGLTAWGRDAIAEMNRAGMVVCCSHAGERTAREAIEVSRDPVIFSHSNAKAVRRHPRNIPDDLIRACAERGGVVGLNGFGPFLGGDGRLEDAFIRHMEHVLTVAGEDHVGLGLDHVFDLDEAAALRAAHPDVFPPEVAGHATGAAPPAIAPWDLPAIAFALRGRGYSEATLAKLFGGNLMRVAAQVWR